MFPRRLLKIHVISKTVNYMRHVKRERKNNAINGITETATRQRLLRRWKLLITARERHFLSNLGSWMNARDYFLVSTDTASVALERVLKRRGRRGGGKKKNNSPGGLFRRHNENNKTLQPQKKAVQDRWSRHLSYLSKFFFGSLSFTRHPLCFFFFFSLFSSFAWARAKQRERRLSAAAAAAAAPSPIWHLPSAHVQNIYRYFQANSFIDLLVQLQPKKKKKLISSACYTYGTYKTIHIITGNCVLHNKYFMRIKAYSDVIVLTYNYIFILYVNSSSLTAYIVFNSLFTAMIVSNI